MVLDTLQTTACKDVRPSANSLARRLVLMPVRSALPYHLTVIVELKFTYVASNSINTTLSGEPDATYRDDVFQAHAARTEATLTKNRFKEKAQLDRAESKRLQQEARNKEKELVKKAKREKKERKWHERRRITKAAPTRRRSLRRDNFVLG
jgi:hypothetical protein